MDYCTCNKPDCVTCMIQSIEIDPPDIAPPEPTSIHLNIFCVDDNEKEQRKKLSTWYIVLKAMALVADKDGFKTICYNRVPRKEPR